MGPMVVGKVPRCENGISIVWYIRADDSVADGHHDRVVETCPTFSHHEVIASFSLIKVGTFYPNPSTGPSPKKMSFPNEGPGVKINFLKPYFSFPRKGRVLRGVSTHIPNSAIVVKKDIGINARGAMEDMRV
jgi:hypothetical protein